MHCSNLSIRDTFLIANYALLYQDFLQYMGKLLEISHNHQACKPILYIENDFLMFQ